MVNFNVRGGSPAAEARFSSTIVFFLLAFGISWTGYLPFLMRSSGLRLFASTGWSLGLILPGVGPAAAVLWVRHLEGIPLAKCIEEVSLSFVRRVSGKLWLQTTVVAFSIPLAAALLTRTSIFGHQPLSRAPSFKGLLLFAALSAMANPCEEIGWRGFAQQRLQQRIPALASALLIGTLWAAWHIPLFLLSSGPMSMAKVPFWQWAAGVPPQAILLAWFYNRSGGSLGIASLFHFSTNVFGSIFSLSWSADSTVRLVAAVLVVSTAGSRLASKQGS